MQQSTEALHHELGRLLAYFGRRLRTSEGMPRGEFNVLVLLKREGPQRSSDLAATEGMDASTMSRRIAAMQERGLVERIPDPSDRRAWLLRITEAGSAAFGAEVDRRLALITDHVANWPPSDVAELARLLGLLNDSFAPRQSGRAHV